MSKQYPECPLYNHATCKELHNPKICAIVREDKFCSKKRLQMTKPEEHKPEYSGDTLLNSSISP